MTPLRLTRIAAACALGSALLLSACSSGEQSDQSGDAAASGSQSGSTSAVSCPLATDAPDVDRSGSGEFPAATGGFGESPTISAGSGDAPDTVRVKTLVEGDGDQVGASDFVLANYTGALWQDGTVFDSSFTRGQPSAFGLDQVIAGWKYGLADQHVGDRVEIAIPCQFAYGDQDTGGTIPAGSALVFVVDIEDTLDATDTSALTAATPTDEALPAGVAVSGDPGAEPTLTLSGETAPAEGTTVLAAGAGPAISDTDVPVYQAVAAYFEDPSSTQSTWTSAGPQAAPQGVPTLVGQTTGSRILLVTPISSDDSQSGSTTTSVMVMDVVGVLSTQG